MRYATGRPPWVLKATGAVAVLAFAVPVLAAGLLLIAASLITMLAWVVFSAVGKVIDTLTAGYRPSSSDQSKQPADDGRENVRVIHKH